MRARSAVVAVAVIAALVGTSCGKVVEKATEKAIENSSGADNVDISKDGVKIESKDGTFEAGATTEMPKDLPKAPMFENASLKSSTKMSDSASTTWLLAGTVKDAKAAYQNLVKALKADGWELSTEMETSNPDYSGIGMATKGNLELNFGTTGGSEKSFYYWMSQSK